MDERPKGTIDESVNSLSDVLLAEHTLDSLLGVIGRLGVTALQGWDAAATSVVEGDRIVSVGISDPRVNEVDQHQYDTDAGPCLDAIRTQQAQYFDGADVPAEWKEFAGVAETHDVRSVLSTPLVVDGATWGAINFYAARNGALQPGQQEEAWVFATQAAIALANLDALDSTRRQVGQLEEGLQTRTLIGQATGILMAQEGLSSQEAFQKLVTVSQTANIKLRDIAARYVEAWESGRRTGS